jgi:hypothetical protein
MKGAERKLKITKYSGGGQDVRFSKNLSLGDFRCRRSNYCDILLADELLEKLKLLERYAGCRVLIERGYLCRSCRQSEGEPPFDFRHSAGIAADVRAEELPLLLLARAAERAGFSGIVVCHGAQDGGESSTGGGKEKDNYSTNCGTGGGYLHLDLRRRKYFAERENGSFREVSTFGGGRSNPYSAPDRPLAQGDRGNKVRWLQWELRRAGYSIKTDGAFGIATRAALRAYQANARLPADGVAGEATVSALRMK